MSTTKPTMRLIQGLPASQYIEKRIAFCLEEIKALRRLLRVARASEDVEFFQNARDDEGLAEVLESLEDAHNAAPSATEAYAEAQQILDARKGEGTAS